MSKSCSCNKRIRSKAIDLGIKNNSCYDVCSNPQCGDPEYLTVLAPVVYDEIGINICRSIDIPTGIINDFPTAVYASAEVIDISFATTGDDAVTVSPISGRPNCYEITLTNLSLTFALKLYDCCKRLLTTITLTDVIYLPSSTDADGYDPDTNPSSVELEIFAPYGVVYENGDISSPSINVIGFSTTNSSLVQGLNLMAIPKVLDFDPADSDITIGLTLVVKSIYFSQYQLPHNGRAVVSKGNLTTESSSVCLDFVEGSLLDRCIKPLEFGNECDNKENCHDEDVFHCDCNDTTE